MEEGSGWEMMRDQTTCHLPSLWKKKPLLELDIAVIQLSRKKLDKLTPSAWDFFSLQWMKWNEISFSVLTTSSHQYRLLKNMTSIQFIFSSDYNQATSVSDLCLQRVADASLLHWPSRRWGYKLKDNSRTANKPSASLANPLKQSRLKTFVRRNDPYISFFHYDVR